MDNKKVIITAALSGSATFKNQSPAIPYSPAEFADEAARCFKAGARMLHIHARDEETGFPVSEVEKVRAVVDAIRQKTPEMIINITSSVGANPEERLTPIIELKPEVASLNTNTMNFSIINRKTGQIFFDMVFTNTFTMLQDFGKTMEELGVRPEMEIYDMGGLDNWTLIQKQGIFKAPFNFNFVWGVAGGQKMRPETFAALVHALPPESNFTSCGVGNEEFPAIIQSCIMGGHMRVGLEDNIRLPNGDMAKGSYELVEVAARIAELLGRELATPAEARKIMGVLADHKT
jgi:3-keto-5-aminohexanoate cleavage enzyme